MKNNIINYLKFLPLLLTILIVSCDNDDVTPEFTLQEEASEDVTFSFSASEEYLISAGTMNNIAERFVWNEVDFGVPTEISYQLQGSVDETFAAYDSATEYDSGTLSVTNAQVTVSDLNNLATLLGMEAGESGQVFFRTRAFTGSGDGADAVDTFSEIMTLNITILEETDSSGIEISTWGVVGSGANNWGATPDLPFYTTSEANVLVAYVNLVDGEIKFRENNDWALNYGDTGADGTLEQDGDNIAVMAGDYKITMNLADLTYTIEAFTIGVVGSAWNDWGGAGPDAKLHYDYTTDTFVVGVKLMDGEFKIRQNNDWGVNYGDTGADGTLEQDGDNIVSTEGFYEIRVSLNDMTITTTATDIFGVVGSGYNDWGATADAYFSQVNPNVWYAESVTLIDGEIKFRQNEDWTVNYGDTGADGTLEQDGDNIAVTAGTYDITLDLTDDSNRTYTLIQR